MSDGISYYIDGAKVTPSDHQEDNDTKHKPGKGILSLGAPFRVYVDELCFWNRTLNNQEIEALYNNLANTIKSDLNVGYY